MPHKRDGHLSTRSHPPTRHRFAALTLALSLVTGCLTPADDAVGLGETPQLIGGGEGPIIPEPGGVTFNSLTDRHANISFSCGSYEAAWHQLIRDTEGGWAEPVMSWIDCPTGYPRFYSDTSIQPGLRYCYTAIAYNDFYDAQSPTECATAPLDTVAPTAPSVSIGSITQGSFTVQLTDRSDNEGWFKVSVGLSNQTPALRQEIRRVERAHRGTGQVFTVPISGLVSDAAYVVVVEVGHDYAAMSVPTTVATRTLPYPPPTPSGLFEVSKTYDSITVGWENVSNESGYTIKAWRDTTLAKSMNVGKDVVRATLGGLTALTQYRLEVIATNAGGASSPSSPILVTTPAAPVINRESQVPLATADPPATGLLSYYGSFGPWFGEGYRNATLQGIDYVQNWPTQTGTILIRYNRPSSDCLDPALRRLVAPGQSLGPSDINFLFGTQSLANTIYLRGCPLFSNVPDFSAHTWRPAVKLRWTTQG